MKEIAANRDSVKTLPTIPGVYLFRSKAGDVVYVGKAKNLKNRVLSYFSQKLELKTAHMVESATSISYIPVESEFEALLLEAKLVKKYRPKYNIELRDDKSPLYIGITKEELPRIILLRQKEIDNYSLRDLFGPFVQASAPKWVLKRIRKIFPYSTHKPTNRTCTYHQIGLCDPCPSEVAKNKELKKDYMLNVRRVKAVMSGKSNAVLKTLEEEMKQASKNENFEQASKKKFQIDSLIYTISRKDLNEGYLENPNLLDDIRERELLNLKNYVSKYCIVPELKRIECFDIAHLSGTYPTASMVTFVNGEPEKALYRHFSMHNKNSDTDNMREVLKRRKKHFSDWGAPDLIIVDGGKGQLSVAKEVISEVPVVGLAKREETLVFKMGDEYYEMKLKDGPAKHLVQRLRDEAHRFARRYHHNLVSKAIREA